MQLSQTNLQPKCNLFSSSYVWHSTELRPLFSIARYMISASTFISTKTIWQTRFFLVDVWWKASPFSDIPVNAHIFHSGIFEAPCSLGIQWIYCNICLTTSNKWVQKNQRAVHEWVNISDDLVYEWVRFSKARYMNGVGFETLARTPVPKLSPSYLPSAPPPPPPPSCFHYI